MLKFALPLSLVTSFVGIPIAIAQVTPALDGTGTTVLQNGNQFSINGGVLSNDGQNLFQSFERFGLDTGQVANFFSQLDVQNILGRVVGGDPSVINGTLQVTGGVPNLYLMNPAGIVFGSQAQLNVPADFTATTATGIEFGADQWFQSVGENVYEQLTGQPTGLYLGNSGAVFNSGNLAVGLGQQLNLVGNDVANFGSLTAPEGHILMMAVPEQGLLRLKLPGYSLGLDLSLVVDNVESPTAWTLPVTALSDLLQLDAVEASGKVAEIAAEQSELTNAAIVAGQLDVAGEQGGTVGVLGDRIGVLNAQIDASGIEGGGRVFIGGDYQGKGATPTASRTLVNRGTVIDVSAIASGNGGEAILWADEATQFSGSISARGGLTLGNGGFAEVSGKESLIYRGEVDLSSTVGEIGTLLLDPENIIVENGAGSTNDAAVGDSKVFFAENPGATFTLSENTLEALPGNANLILEATNNIQINDLADGQLSLQQGTGFIRFAANNQFLMIDRTDNIETAGRDIEVNANSILAGNIRADSPNTPGDIRLIATNDLEVGALRAVFTNLTPAFVGDGSNIFLNAGGTLIINASESSSGINGEALGISSFSANGNAEPVEIRANGDINIVCPQGFCVESFAGGIPGIDARGNGADIIITSEDGSVSISNAANDNVVALNAGAGAGFDAGNITVSGQTDVTIPGIIIANAEIDPLNNANVTAVGGNIDITTEGNLQVGDIDSSGKSAGLARTAARGNVQVGSIRAEGTERSGIIDVNSREGTIVVNAVQSSSDGIASAVDIASRGDIRVGSIDASGRPDAALVHVNVNSTDGSIVVGTIDAISDDASGFVDVASRGSIQVDSIDTTGTNSGGRVNVNSAADTVIVGTVRTASDDTAGRVNIAGAAGVQVDTIDAEGNRTGGVVDVSSATSVQASSINAQGAVEGGLVLVLVVNEDIDVGSIQTTSDATGGNVIVISDNGSLRVDSIDTQGGVSGGSVDVNAASESIVVGTIASASDQVAGRVSVSALGDIQVGDINASGTATSGGAVALVSDNESVVAGNIQAASDNQGGSVTIASPDDIQIGFIDAQGDVAGGSVDITTDRLFRATSSFVDDNGIDASISSAGATDGQVIVRHDGGNQTIPFVVGDASVNGTSGAITTGAGNTIPATRGFIGSYTQGDIQIVTADFLDSETAEFPPSQEIAEVQDSPFWLDEYFTRQFEAQMGESNDTVVQSLDEIQETLRKTRDETGVTPALIYVIFEPQNLANEANGLSELANRGNVIRAEPGEDDSIYLVLVPPEGNLIVRRADASKVITEEEELGATRGDASYAIAHFREALDDSAKSPDSLGYANRMTDSAQVLYQWFLGPLRESIDANNIENLVYIMEPGLRSVPLAALSAMHDGKDFTIRDYSIGLMPSFSLTDTRYQDIRNSQLRAMGTSNFADNAEALPAAPVEVETISQIWPRSNAPVMNDDFTWQALKAQRSSQSGILHLATHATFDTDEPTESFIRLDGDEVIPLGQLREIGLPIELLVLSACETAFDGNGYESELGFGGLAVQTGVKSALASLWEVDDIGTFALMGSFYDRLRGDTDATIKAEALRQAQLAMLDGQVRIENGYVYYSSTAAPIPLPKVSNAQENSTAGTNMDLSHPFHWAGFTMIGSPW